MTPSARPPRRSCAISAIQVETACDGPAMLRKLADAPAACDLIITDYAMPLMSGCEMLKQARGLLPEIPAILISGYADDQALADAPAGVAVLRKPFTLGHMSGDRRPDRRGRAGLETGVGRTRRFRFEAGINPS